VRSILAVIVLAYVTGCTSVVHIASGPSDADVLVDGTSLGKTPCDVRVHSDSQVYVKHAGYLPYHIVLGDSIYNVKLVADREVARPVEVH
jgi:hypothetical protein